MPSGVYKRTPENTKNVGKSGKGKPAWNKGKPRTWKSGKDFEKGHEPWNKGRKRIRFGLDKQEFEAGRKKPESCEVCGLWELFVGTTTTKLENLEVGFVGDVMLY
jgi:hypothetical protein